MTLTVDTVKAIFTYLTAMIIAVGGLFLIATQELAPDTKTILGAFVGSALTFLFGQEVQTRTARQTTAASTQGAIVHANGLSGETPKPTA